MARLFQKQASQFFRLKMRRRWDKRPNVKSDNISRLSMLSSCILKTLWETLAYPPLALAPSRQVFRQRSFLFLQSGCRRFGRERQRKRAKRKGRTDGRTAEQCFHKGRNDVGRLHFQVAKVGKLGPDGNIFIVLHI